MSPSGVYHGEMAAASPDPFSTDPLEAVLGGSVTPGDNLDLLASFVDEVRVAASGPAPEPKANLAAMISGGLSPDPAPAGATEGAATEPSWRSKRMSIRTALAKAGGLGLAAKIALGTGVAAASVTTAGAAGVLPEPAHDVVAEVVAATTPFKLPEQAKAKVKVADSVDLSTVPAPGLPDTDDVVGGDDLDGSEPDDGATSERTANHGLCVSTAAQAARQAGLEGRERGEAVSQVARSDCGKPSASGLASTPDPPASGTGDDEGLDDAEEQDRRGGNEGPNPGSSGGGQGHGRPDDAGPGSGGPGSGGPGSGGPGSGSPGSGGPGSGGPGSGGPGGAGGQGQR